MPTSTQPSGLLTPLYPLLFVVLWSTGFIGARFGLPDAEPLTFLSPRYNLALGFAGVGLVVAHQLVGMVVAAFGVCLARK